MVVDKIPLLRMKNIVKKFGGNIACNDVSIEVHPGKILALLGENGAGKSTMIKVLAGIYPKDLGEIYFKDQLINDATDLKKNDDQPISFIHQDLGLIDWMTVGENMAFGMGFGTKSIINWKLVNKRAQWALNKVGIDIDPQTRVFDLSRTEKSLLAIARAIAIEAEVLVLDEPTASLPAQDVKILFEALRILQSQGVGMIYVTHRLDEVMDICDEVAVMRDGHLVATGNVADFSLRGLVEAIVGEKGSDHTQKRIELPTDTATILDIKDLVVGDTGPVSFKLKAGEMLALAGLRGAGQEEVGRMLFGLRKKTSGSIALKDKPVNPKSAKEAIKEGISMVARDRTGESLVMEMTVQENMFLNPTNHNAQYLQFYPPKQELEKTEQKIKIFDVRPDKPDIEISALSGGNQQKVVMARWLDIGSPLLILEDPTAGVDVGARAEIYDLLNESLANNISILLISTDFEEISNICNRALIFNRGQVVGELVNQEVSFANILELATQTSPNAKG